RGGRRGRGGARSSRRPSALRRSARRACRAPPRAWRGGRPRGPGRRQRARAQTSRSFPSRTTIDELCNVGRRYTACRLARPVMGRSGRFPLILSTFIAAVAAAGSIACGSVHGIGAPAAADDAGSAPDSAAMVPLEADAAAPPGEPPPPAAAACEPPDVLFVLDRT